MYVPLGDMHTNGTYTNQTYSRMKIVEALDVCVELN